MSSVNPYDDSPEKNRAGGGLDDIDEDDDFRPTTTTTTTTEQQQQPQALLTAGSSSTTAPTTTADQSNKSEENSSSDLKEKEEEDDGTILGLFSIRKPVDAEAGISSGLKSAGKGIAAGLGMLLAAPVAGFQKEGAAGLVKGLGVGIAAAVVLPCAGIGVGVVQAARGVANTPEAIKNRTDERLKWDEEKREWVEHFYSLDGEFAKLTADGAKPKSKYANGSTSSSSASNANNSTRPVKSTELYDVIGVAPTATKQEITRAYYKLALQLHPDRNQGKEGATEHEKMAAQEEAKQRFQKVAAAYEILGNEVNRAKYDRDGIANKSAAELDGNADSPEKLFCSAEFINALFSSQDLESFTGELYVASLLEIVGDADGVFDHMSGGRVGGGNHHGSSSSSLPENMSELLEYQSALRSVKLAQQLRKRMQGWVRAPHDEAREHWLEGFRTFFDDMCFTKVWFENEEEAKAFVEAQRLRHIAVEERKRNSIGGKLAELKKDLESKLSTTPITKQSPAGEDASASVAAGVTTTTGQPESNSSAAPATAKSLPLPTFHTIPNKSKAALIEAVGTAYVSRAREFLGSQDSLSFQGRVERIKGKARTVITGGKMAVSAAQAYREFNKAAQKQQAYLEAVASKEKQQQQQENTKKEAGGAAEGGTTNSSSSNNNASSSSTPLPPPPNAEEAFVGGISGILKACEHFNLMDVEKAAHDAVGKLLGDMTVPRAERNDLANGVIRMGLLMQAIAQGVMDKAEEEEEVEELERKEKEKERKKRAAAAEATLQPDGSSASSSSSASASAAAASGLLGRVQQAAMKAHEARTEKKRKSEEDEQHHH